MKMKYVFQQQIEFNFDCYLDYFTFFILFFFFFFVDVSNYWRNSPIVSHSFCSNFYYEDYGFISIALLKII